MPKPIKATHEEEIKTLRQRIAELEKHLVQGTGNIDTSQEVAENEKDEGKLLESKDFFHLLLGHMLESFTLSEVITDEDGQVEDIRFLAANAAHEQLTGMKPQDVIGKTIREIMPQVNMIQLEPYIKVALTGKPLTFEYHAASTNRYFRVKVFCPQPGQFATILEDITGRKQAELALQESEARFSAAFHSSPAPQIISIIETGIILDVNLAYCNLVGYSREELVGHTTTELNLWSEKDRQKAMTELHQHGKVQEMEADIRTRSGEVRDLVISIEPIVLQGRQCIISTGVDITQRKNADLILSAVNAELEKRVVERTAELRQSEERLRLVVENSYDGINLLDLSTGKYIFFNSSQTKMIGFNAQELEQMTDEEATERCHPEDREISAEQKRRLAIGESAPFTTEYRWKVKSGEYRWFSDTRSLILDENGKPTALVGISKDITARKQAEQKLAETNAALEKALHAKDEFMAAMTHELRTPLAGILGMSEVLKMGTYDPLTEKQLKAVNTIESSGKRLLELVTDILDYSQLQSGNFPFSNEDHSLEDICQSALKLVQPLAAQKNQTTYFEMDPDRITLRIDVQQLQKALQHLLQNASKFTADGGEFGITVNGDHDAHLTAITVWDRGIGIKEEDLPKLFKPFVQLDASLARQYEGSGLGLALVKQIAELLGGNVSVTSVFGEGSRFTLTLPWE